MLKVKIKIKDLIFLLLYVLIMFLVFAYGAYIMWPFLMGALKLTFIDAAGILGEIYAFLAVALYILVPVAFVIYYCVPFVITRLFIKKKWSRYVNLFFNNIWLMTLALIVIHICATALYKTEHLNDLLFMLVVNYKVYIAPQCIFIYIVFCIRKIYKKCRKKYLKI